MTADTINLEWLVAEVIRRLQKLSDVTASPASPAAAPPVAVAEDRTARDLVLDTRVVTLAAIERQLANVQRVLIRPGTVVTPSVKDDLRKRNIRLEFLAEPAATDKAAEELTVVRCTRTAEAARAAGGARPSGGGHCHRL